MSEQTGEIQQMIVRVVVIDRGTHSAETTVSSVEEIAPEMIKSVSDHLIKRLIAEVKVERSRPHRRDQLSYLETEA